MRQNALHKSELRSAPYSSELTTRDFEEISNLIRETVGIQLTEAKRGLVKSRLQKRLRALGLSSYSDYVALINSPEGSGELEELISAISTNVTAFNREPHHFVHFRENVLPDIVNKLKMGKSVRLWSAGCSNGSEPYTIACSVMDAFPSAVNHDFQILATDIDKYSLEIGRNGIYSEDMVAKMPSEGARAWFAKTENGYEIDQKVRSLVSFKTLNLMTNWPLKRKYEAIFCRNVMIYFSQEDQAKILTKFTNHLFPGAYLYIGHSERVVGESAENLIAVGATTYQYNMKKGSL